MQNCEKNVDEKLLSPMELSKNKVATLYTGPMASGKTTAVITEIQKWGGEGYSDHPDNVASLAVYLCTYASPNINGYVLGVRGGSLYVYSNPEIEKIVNKWGNFTMEEMDSLFPKMMGTGF